MLKRSYELKNWNFAWRGDDPALQGEVHGHYKYPDGFRVTTTIIQAIKLERGCLKIETENSICKVALEEHRKDTSDIKDALEYFMEYDKVYEVHRLIEDAVYFKKEKKIDALLKVVSAEYSPCILLCLNAEAQGYGDCFLVYDDFWGRPVLHEFDINIGGYSGPTCLALDMSKLLNIGYRISPKKLSFYRWHVPDDYEVYFLNTGPVPLYCDGQYCGFELAPEELRRIPEAERHTDEEGETENV